LKNRWYRYFWTELGRRIARAETDVSVFPRYIPDEMASALRQWEELPDTGKSILRLDSRMSPRESRSIYGYTWKVLNEHGFNRSLRLSPAPGITLLIPFYRGRIGVLPQSFSRRIPADKRAYSLVGRSAAALSKGISLWIVTADWNEDVLSIFESGGVKACSLDNLHGICKDAFS